MTWKRNRDITIKKIITFWIPVIAIFVIAGIFVIGSIIGNLAMILIGGGLSAVVTCFGFAVAFLDIANNFRR